jgi:hypothetical protein
MTKKRRVVPIATLELPDTSSLYEKMQRQLILIVMEMQPRYLQQLKIRGQKIEEKHKKPPMC